MEGLGKRVSRESDSEENSSSEEEGGNDSSQNEEQHYERKRARHDSDEDENDQSEEDYEEQEQDPEIDEEELLKQQVRYELMQEDEAFKHLSKEEIQKLINEAEGEEEVKFDKTGIKKMINNLKTKLNENLEKRIQYKNDPEHFLETEAELHTSLKQMQSIGAYPQFVGEFIRSAGVDILIEILDHPNPDIVIESVILLTELIDEELLNQVEEAKKSVDLLVQNEVWNFLVRLLQKLKDDDEDERKQIFRCLSLLENLLDASPSQVANKLMHVDTLIDWFIIFLEQGDTSSENYLQSAELLFSIVQNCHEEFKSKFATTLNGMERLLGILNYYRKDKKLESEEEHEAIVNLFDIICSLLLAQENQDIFRQLQAFDMLMSLSKKQQFLRRHIMKVFDYSLAQYQLNCKKNCKYFVDKGGLPIVFGSFMLKAEEYQKQKLKKAKIGEQLFIKLSKEDFQEDEKHILNVILGLIINTIPEDESQSSVIHERIIFKFIENNYEKLQRLFELHLKYFQKVEDFDLTKFNGEEEIDYLIQDYGFNILQLIDTVIGFLLTSEAGQRLSQGDPINQKINEFMKFNGIKKEQIKEVLRIHAITIGDDQNQLFKTLADISNKIE